MKTLTQTLFSAEELYAIYARWTGQLHFYIAHSLGRHLNVEFFPDLYEIHLYPGDPFCVIGSSVPKLERPATRTILSLPKPEDNPSPQTLDETFRKLCISAAFSLGLELEAIAQELEPPSTMTTQEAFQLFWNATGGEPAYYHQASIDPQGWVSVKDLCFSAFQAGIQFALKEAAQVVDDPSPKTSL